MLCGCGFDGSNDSGSPSSIWIGRTVCLSSFWLWLWPLLSPLTLFVSPLLSQFSSLPCLLSCLCAVVILLSVLQCFDSILSTVLFS